MLSYDDIKNMKRGKEAEIQDQSAMLAARKLEEIAAVENQQTQQMDDQNLKADAQKIIQELQNNPDLDPQEVMDSLPPVLQHAVLEQMGQIESGPEEEAMEGDPMADDISEEAPMEETPMEEAPIEEAPIEESIAVPRKL